MHSLFISDIHLGSRSANSEKVLQLLKTAEKENVKNIFLIGDIIDGWKFARNKFKWSTLETQIIRKLLKLLQKGVVITYIPGNHDEFMREYLDFKLIDNFYIKDEVIFKSPDNKKYLIIHGDQFDAFIKHKFSNKMLFYLGDALYETMIYLSRKYMDFFNSKFSISKFLKERFKNAMMYVSSFEDTLKQHAIRNQCDSVICGHIHYPKIKEGYLNTGDFVENNSFIWMNDKGKFYLEKG